MILPWQKLRPKPFNGLDMIDKMTVSGRTINREVVLKNMVAVSIAERGSVTIAVFGARVCTAPLLFCIPMSNMWRIGTAALYP